MTTTAERTTMNKRGASANARPAAPHSPLRGRRQLPLVVIGVLLVLGGALAFADASLHLGSRQEVLVVSQRLAAGDVLTARDVSSVRMSTGSGVAVIALSDEAGVIGRPVAVPLVAGALLTRAEIGSPSPVAAGSDVVAVGLKPGQYPPDLAPGDRVLVVPVASSSSSVPVPSGSGSSGSTSSSTGTVSATVLTVDVPSADSQNPTVFSLRVSSGGIQEVAALAAAGDASLVQVGSGAG
jgi:flagellar basal body P-ring formation chaperone FlgA